MLPDIPVPDQVPPGSPVTVVDKSVFPAFEHIIAGAVQAALCGFVIFIVCSTESVQAYAPAPPFS